MSRDKYNKHQDQSAEITRPRAAADGRGPLGLFIHLAGCSAVLFIGFFWLLLCTLVANNDNDRGADAERIPALVTKLDLGEFKTGDDVDYAPTVGFKFNYKGKEYAPIQWQLHDNSETKTKEEAQAVLSPYKVGQTVTAYVNKEDPQRSVIDISYPDVFLGFYFMEAFAATFFCYGLAWAAFLFVSFRSLKTGTPISRRDHLMPVLLGYIPWVLFCAIDMIWYWTHCAPPYSRGSYAVFAIPVGLGLLGWLRPNWLVSLLVLLSYIIRPLRYFRDFRG